MWKVIPIFVFAMGLAGCDVVAPWSFRAQHFKPLNPSGVDLAQGEQECDEEATKATAGIGNFASAVYQYDAVKVQCLRLSGY